MIIALCALVCLTIFLGIAFIAVYVQIVRPMQHELRQTKTKQAEQEDLITRNAKATVGLYFANRREINKLVGKLGFVEAYVVPVLPEAEKAPITIRSAEMTKVKV